MNVLHIDEQRGWRGGEQQASWLIQGLVRRGHAVTLAGRPGGAFLASEHGGVAVERVAVPMRGEWDLSSVRQIARVVRACDIDILHAHTSHAHLFACLARRFAGQGRVVVHRRVGFPPNRGLFNRWKYAQPDHFVCVSEKVAMVMAEYGIPEAARSVVHSAVDLSRVDVPPLRRTELGVPEEAPLLVNAGALVGHKDHENLLAALVLVRDHLPTAQLCIAGEGALRPVIERRLRELGLTDALRLLGNRNDAPALIRAGDVYVSSSSSEGLGTSILEALASGTPVVATEAGGAAEMVLPGETGWLVPCKHPAALAEAILACLGDRPRAAAMAARGRALVEEKFSVDRMIEGNLLVYERVLGMGQ